MDFHLLSLQFSYNQFVNNILQIFARRPRGFKFVVSVAYFHASLHFNVASRQVVFNAIGSKLSFWMMLWISYQTNVETLKPSPLRFSRVT